MIADSTGGRAFFNTNDLKNAIRNALDDSEITYTLGFYADSKSLDSAVSRPQSHVETPDKYQDVEVRFRKGYMAEPDPPPTADERASNIRDVIWSPLEATAIRFTGKIEPARSGRQNRTLHWPRPNHANRAGRPPQRRDRRRFRAAIGRGRRARKDRAEGADQH
jgi:hypothetical protein